MIFRIICVSEYQRIIHVVISRCDLIASWQQTADLRCVALITTCERRNGAVLAASEDANTLYNEKQVRVKEHRHYRHADFMHCFSLIQSIQHQRLQSACEAQTHQSVCFPGWKHDDVTTNRADTSALAKRDTSADAW